MLHLDDTICAIATPPGEGGVAIARVSGPDARSIAARVFVPARGSVAAFASHSVHYGRIVEPAAGETIDSGLLLMFHAPASFTGEDVVELSFHGGYLNARRVIDALMACGARVALPGEFTQRAFLHGKLDLAQAEAVCDQIRAGTEAARRVAARQRDGVLSREVADLRASLVRLLAGVEAAIDFPDEIGEFDRAGAEHALSATGARLASLVEAGARARVYREGARVAIVGRPNVGKSSLLNALLRERRAIVAPAPGTTRDTIEGAVSLLGVPVTLVDTAGLRETDDAVERMGAELARAEIERASAVMVVADAGCGWGPGDDAIACEAAARPMLRVLNKADLLADRGAAPAPGDAVVVSARTGAGIGALEERVAALLCGGAIEAAETVLVSNARHLRALEAARQAAGAAAASCAAGLPADIAAVDIAGALQALGEITGDTLMADVIDAIFREFCVGK